ncbi:hypothetical protein QZH41_005735 [Actinostola sp. cb2023]|nr:hypothetical protein QZH41_005735 [Actinostola sp. cb2023]
MASCKCNWEIFGKILCIILLLLQGGVLDYYLVKKSSSSYLGFITTDVIVLAVWVTVVFVAKSHCNIWMKMRHPKFPKFKVSWKKSRNFDQEDAMHRENYPDELPYAFIAWFAYTAVTLVPEVAVIFKNYAAQLEDVKLFHQNVLKIALCITPILFLLLVNSHHNANPNSSRKWYVDKLTGGVTLDLIDSIDFLEILFLNDIALNIPETLENAIIAFACINFFLPTLALLELSVNKFDGQRLETEKRQLEIDNNSLQHRLQHVEYQLNNPSNTRRANEWTGMGMKPDLQQNTAANSSQDLQNGQLLNENLEFTLEISYLKARLKSSEAARAVAERKIENLEEKLRQAEELLGRSIRAEGREQGGRRQGAGSREQRAGGREQRAESREQRAESREQRAESRESRESREQRAESREQRAESREQRAEQRESREQSVECREQSVECRAQSRISDAGSIFFACWTSPLPTLGTRDIEDDDIHSRILAVNDAHRKYQEQDQAKPAIDVEEDIVETNLGQEYNFERHDIGSVDSLGLPYDYESIMHYGKKTFTRNGGNTLEIIGNPQGKLGRSGSSFSAYDKTAINALYECSKYPGKWLYFPTSTSATYRGKKVNLVNRFGWGKPFCLTFYYSMDGPSVGTLSVVVRITMRNDKRSWTVFTARGSKGREWHLGEAFINVKDKNFEISFEASGTGSDKQGTIALDDIYESRHCPNTPTASPVGKNIVIVLDTSTSMAAPVTIATKTSTILAVAKAAVNSVLNTLLRKDQVGVVLFSTKVLLPGNNGTCYSEGLASASTFNVNHLKKFINGAKARGGTHYRKGFEAAFRLLENSAFTKASLRLQSVILFLTDGPPSDIKNTVIQSLRKHKSLWKQARRKLAVLTYGIGSNIKMKKFLKRLSKETGTIDNHVENVADIQAQLTSYYKHVHQAHANMAYTVSPPYVDAWGLGVLITVAMPCTRDGLLKGVAGIDITMPDLLSEIQYFNQAGPNSYAFIAHQNGNVLSHPLMPAPETVTKDPSLIHILSLERANGFEKLFEQMMSVRYLKAKTYPNQLMFTTPYRDPLGAGLIITISHSITMATQNPNDKTLFGVVAADLTISYLDILVKNELGFRCKDTKTTTCFLVDTAGYVVFHPRFVQRNVYDDVAIVKSKHITEIHGHIASYLINVGAMKKMECQNFSDRKLQLFYEVGFNTKINSYFGNNIPYLLDLGGDIIQNLKEKQGRCDTFAITRLPKTNIFVVAAFANAYSKCYDSASCSCGQSCNAASNATFCECPCTKRLDYYYCSDTIKETIIPSCTAPSAKVTSRPPLPRNTADLPKCFDPQCEELESEGVCRKTFGCSWCKWEDKKELDVPFCAYDNVCYGGVHGRKNPFLREIQTTPTNMTQTRDAVPAFDQEKSIVIAGLVASCCLLVMVISIYCFCSRKKTPDEQSEMDGYYDETEVHDGMYPQEYQEMFEGEGDVTRGYEGYIGQDQQDYQGGYEQQDEEQYFMGEQLLPEGEMFNDF